MRSTIAKTCLGVALSTMSFACSDDGNAGQTGEDSTETGGADDGSVSATQGQSSTQTASTTASTTAVDTGGEVTTDDGEESAGFINPETGVDSGGGGPQPNGAQCEGNDGCESGFCYVLPMIGGVCGECLMDADCEMGTCALSPELMYAVCTNGELGDMCDSDEGCMGELVCTELIDTGGFFNASFCSTCGPTLACEGDQICNPTYDAGGFSGHLECVAPGTVPNGSGCPIDDTGTGDGTPCASGFCSVADVFMGFVQLGVCGECVADEDCMMGQTCMPAQAGQGGLMGSVCG